MEHLIASKQREAQLTCKSDAKVEGLQPRLAHENGDVEPVAVDVD